MNTEATTVDRARLAEIRGRTLREAARLPVSVGRYQVRGELGRGGMGIVYDAYDPELARAVAVKVLDRETRAALPDESGFARRFEREMRATSELFHPNLVAILDAGLADGSAYYVMERIEGESLEQRIRRAGPIPRRAALGIAACIARGLEAAHARGLVHRDLKPSNVLLPWTGPPKVADFGLCEIVSGDGLDADGPVVIGSPHYLAPEQVRGEPVSSRTDLFALGAVLIRMLVGVEPFPAPSWEEHLARIVHGEPSGRTELDADVRRLVDRLMAKAPEDRPPDAQAVADQLAALAADRPRAGADGTTADHPGRRDTARRPLRRSWAYGAAGLLVLASLVLLAALRNELVALDRATETRWSQVENQLARQNELVPALLAVAARTADYERAHVAELADALARYDAAAPRDRPAAAGELERALWVGLLDDLRPADREGPYHALAYEIAGTKNRIALERARYNAVVGRLNQRLSQLPWSLLRGSLRERAYFAPPPERLREPDLVGAAS